MKKFLKLTALVFCLNLFGMNTAQAAQSGDSIRVGLEYRYKSVYSVPINNTGITVGFDLNGDAAAQANLTGFNGFTVNADYSYYADTNERFSDYQSAYQRAQNYKLSGYDASAVLTGYNSFSVYVGPFQSAEEAYSPVNAGYASAVISPSAQRINIKTGADITLIAECNGFYPLIWDINGNIVELGDRSYRGTIEFGRYTAGGITAVNVLDIDEYLYSVVPSEMPSAWHIEALKAQTVAARSYTYTRMGVHSDSGYDICDGIHCQVYNGYANETESSLRAVNETKGLVAYAGNEIINATFFSSSGGYTEDSENVWANEISYLRATADPYEVEYRQWSRSFTLDEITAMLIAKNINIGSVMNVTAKTGANGRVAELTFNGTSGTHTVTKDEVRTIFSSAKGGSLESKNFTITDGTYVGTTTAGSSDTIVATDGESTYAVDTTAINAVSASGNFITDSGLITVRGSETSESYNTQSNGNTVNNASVKVNSYETYVSTGNIVTFSGRGWGHGVGLSQYGAKGMAEAGFTYEEILKHYYTGITIK